MVISNLADYQVWAGEKMRGILATLNDVEFSQDVDGTNVNDICTHIVHALEYCFLLMEGGDVNTMFARVASYTKKQLLQRWHELENRLADLMKSDPEGTVTVPHVSEWPFTLNKIDFSLQYILHTTHHRGHLARILRRQDKDVPGTDYLVFFSEKQS